MNFFPPKQKKMSKNKQYSMYGKKEVNMVRAFAIIFGLSFFLIGISGFIPQFTPNEHLLGLFYVNAFHNIVHLASGIIFFCVGMKSAYASKIFFRIFGVIYLLVAILGFFYRDQVILGLMSNNMADTWLHLVLSIVMLYLGFRSETRARL